jgi:hypothetical protein
LPRGATQAIAHGARVGLRQLQLLCPDRILKGDGKQNRFVPLPTVEALPAPGVVALVRAAIAQAKVPLAETGAGITVIQSVSAKQRPRRKARTGTQPLP